MSHIRLRVFIVSRAIGYYIETPDAGPRSSLAALVEADYPSHRSALVIHLHMHS